MSEAKRFGEYIQDSTRAADANKTKARLHDAIKDANRRLAREDYAHAGHILRDVIVPAIKALPYTKEVQRYHADLHHDDEYDWHWAEFRSFLDDPDRHIAAVESRDPTHTSRVIIERALESAESISTYHSVTMTALKNKVDVVGFSGKTGEHLQDYEMDIGDPVQGVSTQAGALKTLFLGGTGSGKSTGVEVETEDFYKMNFQEGRDCKIIDVAGLRDGENWFYDVPQQQPALKRIRDDMGLPETFEEDEDHGTPRMEVLLPLTLGLSEKELPYDTDREEFVTKPFVVPASSLRKTLLVSFIACRLSDGEEETIRSAYETVNRSVEDWSLRDLADEIRSRDELPPKNKATAINVLRSLQDTGMIRTRDHPMCINWRDIFEDSKTITVISQALCDDMVAKLIVFAYLVDTIAKKREQMIGVPQCALVMRELWKIAPHTRRQSAFPEVAALQEAIAQMLAEIFRENRHSGIHIIADTQQPSDLTKPVREMFNRYVVYNTDKDTLKDIFSWTYNSRYQSFYNTLSAKAGEAGIVGQVEPAVEHRDIEFLSPVRFAPPSHHHRVTPGDDVGIPPDLTGWHGRVNYHDHEELCRPCDIEGVEWDDSLPAELEVAPAESAASKRPDPETSPVAAFVDRCLKPASISEYTLKSDAYDAFNEFLIKHKKDRWDFNERSRQTTFGKRVKEAFPEDISNKEREGEMSFVGAVLTPEGRELLDNARNEVQSSAEPIVG